MTKVKFYQESLQKRRALLQDQGKISSQTIKETPLEVLNELSENVIGQLSLPLAVVPELCVNDKIYSVPMATEEPSVVAAANHGATIFNRAGGTIATSDRKGIYGQLLLVVDAQFCEADFKAIFAEIPALINRLNSKFASLVAHGGGVRSIDLNLTGELLELRVLVDPAAAMGANKVNSILEELSSFFLARPDIIESELAILSNYPTQLTTAKVWLPLNVLDKTCTEMDLDSEPTKVAQAIANKFITSVNFAQTSKLRAPTNNKGIMNGVDGVLLATGNDFRAVEAATHMFASLDGQYKPLSSWRIERNRKLEFLVGQLTIPLPIGVVGGSINTRLDVQESFEILGNPSVSELAEICASIGLANNFAALLALATSGIQAGHMKLQVRNMALAAGATVTELGQILPELLAEKELNSEKVQQIITNQRNNQKKRSE